jgi:ACS family pantothenate transporter-like MFS transporter
MRFDEAAFRGVVLAGMNVGSNAVNAWWSILFYGASMAPWFNVSSPFIPLPPFKLS